ncbi:SDR family oxidoreductase [Polyangium sp. 6x1]|uniref:SDR family oxidoreductase n=1 Tax=Polyangium sp. 6x1 TaxID=3042689 RepID=UPI0024827B06|nr:SDR family oxidoreductase [Polyangium sp. 6x1]MDI1445448.1 SDR family oxidoreductase [Polyangium sp. 6x1]
MTNQRQSATEDDIMRFQGKVALVTGGTSGLGRATAEAFAREGAKVVIAARRVELGREVEGGIRASGGDATFVRCDVTNEQEIKALVEHTVKLYGRLDCAYNNAWVAPKMAPLAEFAAEFDANFACLRGLFACLKYEIGAMIASGGGAIVNGSSATSRGGAALFGTYGAAKAGLESVTRTAALEYAGQNIRVNSLCLGAFDTPMSRAAYKDVPPKAIAASTARIAVRRLGHADEAAETVLFLCSPGAGYITGANIAVDGGYFLT